MPIYKDTSRNTWYVEVHATIEGQKIRKKKRGFKTKKLAQEWEREYLSNLTYNANMTMHTVMYKYLEDKKIRWKMNTYNGRKLIINKHLDPFFGSKMLADVKAKDILRLQNKLLENGSSLGNLKGIESLLTAIFNYICTYHDIKENVMSKVEKLGRAAQKDNKRVWTEKQFNLFIDHMKSKKKIDFMNITVFHILFYTGLRAGEISALNWSDIDLEQRTLRVDKTLYRKQSTDYITEPKTEGSKRVIQLDSDTIDIINKYKSMQYDVSGRVFITCPAILTQAFRLQSKEVDLPYIRLHDLRHSHASMLLSKGAPIGAISKRLGHTNVSMTLDVYSHVLSEDEQKLMDAIENKGRD